MSTYVMWISIFAATISLGICFCVATIMMKPKSDRSPRRREVTGTTFKGGS